MIKILPTKTYQRNIHVIQQDISLNCKQAAFKTQHNLRYNRNQTFTKTALMLISIKHTMHCEIEQKTNSMTEFVLLPSCQPPTPSIDASRLFIDSGNMSTANEHQTQWQLLKSTTHQIDNTGITSLFVTCKHRKNMWFAEIQALGAWVV